MLAVISLVFWLLAVPFCIGLIPANFISAEKRSPGFVLLSGYFGMWALFALSAMPAVLWVEYDNFKAASVAFTVLTLLCAAAGVWLLYRNTKSGNPGLVAGTTGKFPERQKESGTGVEWLLFFVLLGFQLYKAAAFASFDGDDAYYVVESLIAQEAGVMYRILPLTGGSTGLDVRHAMAVFPMWTAFVSVRAGVHATIVSHVVMPLVLIPLTYLLYYEIGRRLFVKSPQSDGKQGGANEAQGVGRHVLQRENLPAFMIIMAMFQIFGNVSIYTNETFFLTRTWQGKAVAGALVIPALFWVLLQIKSVRKGRTDAGLWILLVCINMTAGVCSSIAVFLVCILIAVAAFCLAVAERDWKILFKVGAACIPNVVYMAVYVVMAYSYLLK
ncbi:MAG: hypothetical protein K2H37_08635 [Lachnospiraceae bacterium]|nr:hypothetical protein [Lachnospiraceae bacterium]